MNFHADHFHAAHVREFRHTDIDPLGLEIHEDHLRDVFGERFQQQKMLVLQVGGNALDDFAVIDGIANIVGLTGAMRIEADVDIEIERLRLLLFPFVEPDPRGSAQFANKNNVHERFSFFDDAYCRVAAMTNSFIAVLIAYLIGSLSFAVIVSKLFGLPDPHTYGSGNPGATNVLRTGKKAAALLTLIGDGAKGWFAVWLAQKFAADFQLGPITLACVAIAVFLGHLFPVFFKFLGGKGVATAAGILLAINVWLGLATLATWIIIAVFFRYSSLAALVSSIFAPFYTFFLFGVSSPYLFAVIAMCALLVWRHKENITKLMNGTESKLGAKKKTAENV